MTDKVEVKIDVEHPELDLMAVRFTVDEDDLSDGFERAARVFLDIISQRRDLKNG